MVGPRRKRDFYDWDGARNMPVDGEEASLFESSDSENDFGAAPKRSRTEPRSKAIASLALSPAPASPAPAAPEEGGGTGADPGSAELQQIAEEQQKMEATFRASLEAAQGGSAAPCP